MLAGASGRWGKHTFKLCCDDSEYAMQYKFKYTGFFWTESYTLYRCLHVLNVKWNK